MQPFIELSCCGERVEYQKQCDNDLTVYVCLGELMSLRQTDTYLGTLAVCKLMYSKNSLVGFKLFNGVN